MLAVVMLAAWADYLVGFWGYCLLRDYDVTIGQLADPLHPYAGKWPPGPIGPGAVFPTGKTAGSNSPASPDSTAAAKAKAAATAANQGRPLPGSVASRY